MAKMYYNSEETLEKLGCNDAQLREMVRSGKLREFRDAGKLNYKVEDVDRLVAAKDALGGSSQAGGSSSGELSLADSGEISLLPDDSGSAAGLQLDDSSTTPPGKSGTGDSDSPVDLSASTGEMKLEESGEISLSDTGTGELKLEDTGTVAPPAKPAKPAPAPKPSTKPTSKDVMSLDEVDNDRLEGMKKDDTVITNIGISVFDEEDLEIAADPLAKTMLTSGGEDHLGLDGSAGGSGLLDLTRESDDTSLGAELLEGIDMGDTGESAAPKESDEGEVPASEAEEALPESSLEPMIPLGPRMVAVQYVDAASPIFTGLLAASAIGLTVLGATVMATSMNAWPSYLAAMADNFWITLGGMLGMGLILAGIGYVAGRPSSPKQPKRPKEPKAKKEKKPAKGKKGDLAPGLPGE